MLQLLALILGQCTVFQEAPERSPEGIIHLADSGSLAVFFLQLHHRLEEVHVAFYQGIEAIQLLQGLRGMVAVVADEPPYHGPVFLLDVGVVVLPVGSGPGEGDALLLAVGVEVVVDELAAVVGIDTQQGKGEVLTDVVDGATHSLLTLAHHAPAGYPAGGDVHGAEGIEVLAFGGFPAVGHQVYFQEAGLVLVPFSEGASGDGGLEQGTGPGGGEGSPVLRMAVGTEQAVDGGGAHGAYLVLYFLLQDQFPVTFQGSQQFREEGLQPLGTDPVAGFLQGPQGSGGFRTVAFRATCPALSEGRGLGIQGADQGLAVLASDPHRFIQNTPLFPTIGTVVSWSDSVQILSHSASRHATLR